MQGQVTVRLVRLPHAEGLDLPTYASEGAAGLDLRAAVSEPLRIEPGQVGLVPTGLQLEVPVGYEAQVRPRSGLALHNRVTVLNTPGTVDSDYRGEVLVILANLGHECFLVERGDRIAQLVIAPVARAVLIEVPELTSSQRDAGGFGHTGVR